MYHSNSKPSTMIVFFSLLAAFVLIFGTAAPALANEFVTDGDFSGNPFSGFWTNTDPGTPPVGGGGDDGGTNGTQPWVWDGSKITATTPADINAYAYQCIAVSAPPSGFEFKASATFLAAGGNVQVWFFDDVCDFGGSPFDSGLLLTPGSPSVSSYIPLKNTGSVGDPVWTPTAPTNILVLATCPPSSVCSVDDISLDGADGTAITLASMKASSQKPWTVLALTSIVLTVALAAFWQARKQA